MSTFMTEPEKKLEDGIVFFSIPYKVDISDWTFEHLDCDAIYTEEEPHSDIVNILCFASSKQYNYALFKKWKSDYAYAKLNRGISSEEVNSFDRFSQS